MKLTKLYLVLFLYFFAVESSVKLLQNISLETSNFFFNRNNQAHFLKISQINKIDLTDLIIKDLYKFKYSTLLIENINYVQCNNYSKVQRKNLNYLIFNESAVIRKHFRTSKKMQHVHQKRIAKILIVGDVETLQSFIAEKGDYFSGNRSMHLIILAESYTGECRKWFYEVGNVLVRIWKELNVLNVVALTPYTCSPYNVYLYSPFHKNNSTSWGLLNIFNLDALLDSKAYLINSLKDMQGYQLDVSMFTRTPTATRNLPKLLAYNPIYKKINKFKSGGYSGFDGIFLANLAEHMNFTVNIIEKTDYYFFGSVLPNGTAVGSLGDVVYKRAHLSVNGRFIMQYKTDEIEFTTPVDNDEICVIVPKAKKIPQWLQLFESFSYNLWLLIFGVFLICTAIVNLICEKKCDRSKLALELFAIFLSLPSKLSTKHFFLLFCMGYSVILVNIFQGTLVRSVSTQLYYSDINTLQELDKSHLILSTTLKVFGDDQTDAVLTNLRKKIITFTSGNSMDVAAFERNVAAMERKSDAILKIHMKYLNNDGTPLLHIVKECPVSYFLSYIVPKGSPFLYRINVVVLSFTESGLFNKWNGDIIDALIMERKLHLVANKDVIDPFSMNDMLFAFIALLFGCAVSLVVFLCELLHLKFKINNQL